MFRKCSILVGLIVLCIILSCNSVFALDFEKLPSGIDVSWVPDNCDVIQTGETDQGIVYEVAAHLVNNNNNANFITAFDNVYLLGYNKITGALAYSVSFVQPGINGSTSNFFSKISYKAKNYFYMTIQDTAGSPFKIAKIDLNTGGIVSYLPGTIQTTGVVNVSDVSNMAVKFIVVSDNDKVFLLAKEPTTSANRILYFNETSNFWTRVTDTQFPSEVLTIEPQGFCAPSATVFYTAFASGAVYKTENNAHSKISPTYNANDLYGDDSKYYPAAIVPGNNANDIILLLYPSDNTYRSYEYYYVYQSGSFNKGFDGNWVQASPIFTNKYFNLTYLSGSTDANLSFWNGGFGILGISNTGGGYWIHFPTSAVSTIPMSNSGSNGTIQPKATDLAHLGSTTDVIVDGNKLSLGSVIATGHITKVNENIPSTYYGTRNGYTYTHDSSKYYIFYYSSYYRLTTSLDSGSAYNSTSFNDVEAYMYGNYIPVHYVVRQSVSMTNTDLNKSYTTLGAFGTKLTTAWIIYKAASTSSSYTPFKTLSPLYPTYGTNSYSITNSGGTGGGSTTSSTSGYALTVIKDCAFKEVIPDDVLGTATSPTGSVTFTRKSVANGSITLYYTLVTGTLTDSDITTTDPTKAMIVNGKLVVFNVINPPSTSAQTATLQFN